MPKGKGGQWSDHFTKKAKARGFAARSIFKLEEIDKKHRLFKAGQRILDLGCHPGSWSRYAAFAVGDAGLVLGVDRRATPTGTPNFRSLTEDIFGFEAEKHGFKGCDGVLSDLAPDTTGIREVDEARSLELAERARAIAVASLAPGGFFLVKVFQGPGLKEWLKKSQANFAPPRIIRPAATRKQSREVFVLFRDFRGGN